MDYCEIPRWQLFKKTLRNLSFEEFSNGCKADVGSICIDARTPEEFAQGHLDKAINLNYLSPDLADQLEALDSSLTYYIYCRTSRRSLRICILLKNMGFENIYHLEDGIKDAVL